MSAQEFEITDPAKVPDEFCNAEGSMPWFVWRRIRRYLATYQDTDALELIRDIDGCRAMIRIPSYSLIRQALEEKCACQSWSYSAMLERGLAPVPCLDEHLTRDELTDIARNVFARHKLCPDCGGSRYRQIPGVERKA